MHDEVFKKEDAFSFNPSEALTQADYTCIGGSYHISGAQGAGDWGESLNIAQAMEFFELTQRWGYISLVS